MKSVIIRSSSSSFLSMAMSASDSFKQSISIPVQDAVERRSCCSSSPSISLQLGVNNGGRSIRRVSSESNLIRSDTEYLSGKKTSSNYGSKSFHHGIPEADERRTQSLAPVEDLGFPGGGVGSNRKFGGRGGGGGDFGNRINMRMYYEQILKSDPSNSLFLRNYAKYLHEVEKDFVKAEECYGRAILTNPGDGEVLSLYGKFIWEIYGDENRAKSYFDLSVNASPNDCMMLGSYAHFLWETETEDEDEDKDKTVNMGTSRLTASAVQAF